MKLKTLKAQMDKEIAYPMGKKVFGKVGSKENADDKYADNTSHTHAKAKCMIESENG
jgi:hypothetical protein